MMQIRQLKVAMAELDTVKPKKVRVLSVHRAPALHQCSDSQSCWHVVQMH